MSLDEAWAEAEAALPIGWRLSGLRPAVAVTGHGLGLVSENIGWTATATSCAVADGDAVEGYSLTPARALHALADELRAAPKPDHPNDGYAYAGCHCEPCETVRKRYAPGLNAQVSPAVS